MNIAAIIVSNEWKVIITFELGVGPIKKTNKQTNNNKNKIKQKNWLAIGIIDSIYFSFFSFGGVGGGGGHSQLGQQIHADQG